MTGLGYALVALALLIFVVCQNVNRCVSCHHPEIPWLEVLTNPQTFKGSDWIGLCLLLTMMLVFFF